MTSWLISAMLFTPGADAVPPSSTPKDVPATRIEFKSTLEDYKKAKPRIPMPTVKDDSQQSKVNNGWFRTYYLSHLNTGSTGGSTGVQRDPDPAMTLDNTFKVKLFWMTSRANNCLY